MVISAGFEQAGDPDSWPGTGAAELQRCNSSPWSTRAILGNAWQTGPRLRCGSQWTLAGCNLGSMSMFIEKGPSMQTATVRQESSFPVRRGVTEEGAIHLLLCRMGLQLPALFEKFSKGRGESRWPQCVEQTGQEMLPKAEFRRVDQQQDDVLQGEGRRQYPLDAADTAFHHRRGIRAGGQGTMVKHPETDFARQRQRDGGRHAHAAHRPQRQDARPGAVAKRTRLNTNQYSTVNTVTLCCAGRACAPIGLVGLWTPISDAS